MLFIAQIIGNTGLFVSVLLVARALGPEGRGTAAFLLVTAQVIARVAGFGLPEATMVLVADPEKRRSLLTNLTVFSSASALVLGLATSFVLLMLGDLRPTGLGGVELTILVAAIVSNAVLTGSELYLMGCGRVTQRAIVAATWPWLYAVLVAALFTSPSFDVAHVAVAWTICQAAGASYALSVAVRAVGFGSLDRSLLRNSFRSGLRLWVGSLALFLNFRVDQMLMGFIASRATLGIYAVSVNLSETLLLLPTAVASALSPIIATSRPADRLNKTLQACRLLLVATVASVLIAAIVGPSLLPAIFGPAFTASVTPFLYLLPGAIGFAVMRVFSSSLLGASAPGRSSAGALVSLVIGVVLDLLLIPRLGAEGAAVAASAAFIAGGVVAVLVYRDHTPFRWSEVLHARAERTDAKLAAVVHERD